MPQIPESLEQDSDVRRYFVELERILTELFDGDQQIAGNLEASGSLIFIGDAGLPHAEISVQGNAVETTFADAGQANKAQVTVFDTNGCSHNMTPDHTNDHITVLVEGIYACIISVSAASTGGDSDEIAMSLFKNNGATEFTNVHSHRIYSGGTGDKGSQSLSGLVDLAVGDTIEVWVWNEDDDDSITIDDMTLTLIHIGGT